LRVDGGLKEIPKSALGYMKELIDTKFTNNEFGIHGLVDGTGVMIVDGSDAVDGAYVAKLDGIAELDWIFNCSDAYVRMVDVGGYVACETKNEFVSAVAAVNQNCFLRTFEGWIWLVDRRTFTLEIEGVRRQMWMGEPCSFQDVLDNSALDRLITDVGRDLRLGIYNNFTRVPIAYARCVDSMKVLDDMHRDYVEKHQFTGGQVIAIKSVAGSGKTTTQLRLSKIHSSKRILYLAFNKGLIEEIKEKVKKQGLTNVTPCTFDALLYRIYSTKYGPPNLQYLNATTIKSIVPWFNGKKISTKPFIKRFSKFCNDPDSHDLNEYCMKKFGKKDNILEQLWTAAKARTFVSYEIIRKLARSERWFKDYVDKNFDICMNDETQDFDMTMLKMLLEDTKLPKLFVGDPKQAIYEWRGSINAFEHMPKGALVIEFYSTFRIGDPACTWIRNQFKDCWMISKAKTATTVENLSSSNEDDTCVYLFRSWKALLAKAAVLSGVWIYGYEKKKEDIRKLHAMLNNGMSVDDDEYEDDLPQFLKKVSAEELDELLANIDANCVPMEQCNYRLHTVHSYKGLENLVVRVCDDADPKKEENIYYVAITRAFGRLIMDNCSASIQGGGVAQKRNIIVGGDEGLLGEGVAIGMPVLETADRAKGKPILAKLLDTGNDRLKALIRQIKTETKPCVKCVDGKFCGPCLDGIKKRYAGEKKKRGW